MAGISSLGIGSGLDLNGLLDQLKDAERQKLTPIVQQSQNYQSKISAYGKLESALDKLKEAAAKLNDVDSFRAVNSSVTGEDITASADADAVPGRYEVTVTNLARAQSLASAGVADKSESLGNAAGTITLTQGLDEDGNPKTVSVDIEADSSLEDIRDAINSTEGIGVTASVVNNGTDYQLVMTSKETGTESVVSNIDVGATGLTQLSYDGTAGGMTQTVTAEDATLEVNGIAITSQSNRLEEAIQGVTLDLVGISEDAAEPSVLNVTLDSETIGGHIKSFVEAYNSLQSTMKSLTSYNAESGSAGLLLGDTTTRSVEAQLRRAMNGVVEGGDFSMLSELGIELQLDGQLEIDNEKFDELVESDPAALSNFFGGIDGEGGLADKLETSLKSMLEDDGLLDTATSGLETSISSLEDSYSRMERSIAATVDRYRSQFAQMDSLVASMNSTMSYLTQQFDMMNAQMKQ